MTALDDLELELRRLPGVHAAGFEEIEDVLLVQLHVGPDQADRGVPVTASRIAARHADRPFAVEVVRWRAALPGDGVRRADDTDLSLAVPAPAPAEPGAGERGRGARPRLLAVLAFPDTDELEVHLVHEGRRTIGRAAASSGLSGAVHATIEAVRELGAPVDPRALWVRALEEEDDERVLVAVALEDEDDEHRPAPRYGLAAGVSPIDAAARSTLDALNRKLSRVL
jgi:hypothetical protein